MPGFDKAHSSPPTLTVVANDAKSKVSASSTACAATLVPHYPQEVTLLLHLVEQLPPGVSPQAGAQIIRATLENMGAPTGGTSLATVLRQAQSVQGDCLNTVRKHMSEIDLHEARIRELEAALQQCQHQANQLSNLIDLFLLADAEQTVVPV